jgi:hypothetical protein
MTIPAMLSNQVSKSNSVFVISISKIVMPNMALKTDAAHKGRAAPVKLALAVTSLNW